MQNLLIVLGYDVVYVFQNCLYTVQRSDPCEAYYEGLALCTYQCKDCMSQSVLTISQQEVSCNAAMLSSRWVVTDIATTLMTDGGKARVPGR